MKFGTFLISIFAILIVVFNNLNQLVIFVDSFDKLIGFLIYSLILIMYFVYNKEIMIKIIN